MKEYIIYVDEENPMSLGEQILEKCGNEIPEAIRSNPAFGVTLIQAINTICYKGNMQDRIPPVRVLISEDGKSFTIRGGLRPDRDLAFVGRTDTTSFEQTKFSLDDKNNLQVLSSHGCLESLASYRGSEKGKEREKEIDDMMRRGNLTMFSVHHNNRLFLANGVQILESSFSDEMPEPIGKYDEKNFIYITTVEHCPTNLLKYAQLPEPSVVINGSSSCYYRDTDNLGIIYGITGENMQKFIGQPMAKGDTTKTQVYQATTEWPEYLTTLPYALGTLEAGEIKVAPNTLSTEEYQGLTTGQIKKKMSETYLKGVDGSKTHKYKPEVYEDLRTMVVDGLRSNYGYVEPQDTEEESVGMHK